MQRREPQRLKIACLSRCEEESQRRGRKREEVRTWAPTQPRQNSQAAVIAVTHTAPATHTPGAAARCCCTLHQPGHAEASLLPRRSTLCSSASHSLQDQQEVPPVPTQPKWAGGSGIPVCTRSQPQSTCDLKHCTISVLSFFPILPPTLFPGGGGSWNSDYQERFFLKKDDEGKEIPAELPAMPKTRLFQLPRLQFFTCHLLWSHFTFISVVQFQGSLGVAARD